MNLKLLLLVIGSLLAQNVADSNYKTSDRLQDGVKCDEYINNIIEAALS